jgi:hypothetical protein
MAQAQVFEHILSPDYLIFLMLHHDESKVPRGVLDILKLYSLIRITRGNTLIFVSEACCTENSEVHMFYNPSRLWWSSIGGLGPRLDQTRTSTASPRGDDWGRQR